MLADNSGAFTAAPNFAFELAVRRTKDEDMGLDFSEHGESAYPAFNGMD